MFSFPNCWMDKITLQHPRGVYQAAISLGRLMPAASVTAAAHLHPKERQYFDSLQFERRIHSYMLGRITAKTAAARLTGISMLSSIRISSGVFDQPILTVPGYSNLGITLSHTGNYCSALAFPEEHPMGVDIEESNLRNASVVKEQLTESECELMQSMPGTYEERLVMFWSAKEALSKVLKTGLTTPLSIFEIHRAAWNDDAVIVEFRHFMQYKAILIIVEGYVFALALPRLSELDYRIADLKSRLKSLTSVNVMTNTL